ncbi:MAG: ABC transporter permease [Candidatus Azobacteroides sp.]|nr:ABC transporter permease [Candidatus Azobacteroides sp.]
MLLIASESGLQINNPIQYKDRTGWFDMKGISENYLKIKSLEVDNGIAFNNLDYEGKRTVAIIGDKVKDVLFEKENPIGKYMNINATAELILTEKKRHPVCSRIMSYISE